MASYANTYLGQIDSGNGLLPEDIKSVPEPIVDISSMQFHMALT